MSMAWRSPSTRIMRWRVRNWVSCLAASHIPLDDDPESNFHHSSPQIKNMVREFGGDGRSQCRCRHHKRRNRRKKERVAPNMITTGDSHAVPNGSLDQTKGDDNNNKSGGRESTSLEDYIVFCFGENGTFEVVKDHRHRTRSQKSTPAADDEDHTKSLDTSNLEPVVDSTNGSSATISTKVGTLVDTTPSSLNPVYNNCSVSTGDELLNCGDQEVDSRHESHEKRSSSTNHHALGSDLNPEVIVHHQEEEENNDTSSTVIRHPLEVLDGNQLVGAEPSSGSKQSDDSSSDSFSFPVLQWEEMVGSPIQMPKPEEEDFDFMMRQRMNCARFQCCRFWKQPH